MKFTLSWLKDHLETDASPAEIGRRLTALGLELESLTDPGEALKGLTVARIDEAAPHPNADKLKVCIVDTGQGRVQVVCGAPNARTGVYGIFAPIGARVPATATVLTRAVIRGVESCGMLLSERELGLSDDHAGIIELAGEAKVGMPAADALGLADPVFDVAITPNRADCLGVRGIARDLAAAGLGRLQPLAAPAVAGQFPSPVNVLLEFDEQDRQACPYFVGRLIRGVKNAESPDWLKRRLKAVGLRPISALVDITNYMTLDLCRPLHVFDADRLRGPLHVRLARDGERLQALDGRTYDLGPEMTVIADDEDVAALGGVIGGTRTSCTAETVNVFVESALFDPVRTAITGRTLGIVSDARYRFERGIDPAFLVDGMEIATRLILEMCGGEPSTLVIAGSEPPRRAAIHFRPERVLALAGVAVAAADSARILDGLGFAVEPGEPGWQVTPPTWRADIVGEACLVEEVIRIHGYEHIPATPLAPLTTLPQPALSASQRRRALARRLLAGRGLVEAVTYSFVSAHAAELFGGGEKDLRLVNPISADLDVMRPSPLPNLIAALGRNAARGVADGSLFEIGPQYAVAGDSPAEGEEETVANGQRMVAAGVRAGRTGPRHWAAPPRPVDAFDAKADALALIEGLAAPLAGGDLQLTSDAPAWYHPGRRGSLRLNDGAVLAVFGEIHPRILRQMDVKGPMAAFEVFLDALPKAATLAERPVFRASSFQPVERDFAFVLAADTPASAVVAAARRAEPALIADVRVFDVFAGDSMGPGRKSLAITVVLQPTEKTLTDAEIETVASRVVTAVEEATGGRLRT